MLKISSENIFFSKIKFIPSKDKKKIYIDESEKLFKSKCKGKKIIII
jgi:hypothetical protein